MNPEVDVEAIVNRNHCSVVTDATDHRKAHRMTLLKRVLLFVALCAASVALQVIGQMGEILATSVFLCSLGFASYFMGRYMETKRK